MTTGLNYTVAGRLRRTVCYGHGGLGAHRLCRCRPDSSDKTSHLPWIPPVRSGFLLKDLFLLDIVHPGSYIAVISYKDSVKKNVSHDCYAEWSRLLTSYKIGRLSYIVYVKS